MNAKMLTPGKTFTAADFTGELTVTITAIQLEDFEVEVKKGQPPKTEKKGTITIAENPKPWVCNVTNCRCLVAMFGDETDRWIGKRVTVYIERIMSFGEWVPGVRIKGSPDITTPVSVTLKLRKKKEQVLTMQPTGARQPQPSPPKSNGKPPTPYEEMWRLFKSAGMTDGAQFKSLISDALHKTKDFTPDDVGLFASAIAGLTGSPPSEPEPPPF